MKISQGDKDAVQRILRDWQTIRGTQLQTDVKYLATALLKAWEHIEFLEEKEIHAGPQPVKEKE